MDERSLSAHFQFGGNWREFLVDVDDARVAASAADIKEFFGRDLTGLSFLDVGCGSGLSSLAAYRLGATAITSVDIDPINIENVENLKKRFSVPETFSWVAKVSSIVDPAQAQALPRSDVVHAWGVLHHTGAMWDAIRACVPLVNPEGHLYLMLYRDSWMAPVWRRIKKAYVMGGAAVQFVIRNSFVSFLIAGLVLKGKNPRRVIREYGQHSRGMSWYVDVVDWVGGYPFEYASAQDVIAFIKPFGFQLKRIRPPISRKPVGYRGTGSYQYLFQLTDTEVITPR